MNNSEILGEKATIRQIVEDDFSATDGIFEDDSVTSIRGNVFRNRTTLKEIKLPNCTTLLSGGSQASSCSMLKKVYFPKINSGTYAYGFQECPKLVFADIGLPSFLEADVFKNSNSLVAVVIRKDSVVRLSQTGVFNGTPYATNGVDDAHVYVPRDLISSYQAATNWATLYAAHNDMFRALEDYTVDGTTTGELDESKIFVRHTPIYSIDNPELDGSSVINTGVKLFDETSRDFTIVVDYTMGASWGSADMAILHCMNETSPYNGFVFARNASNSNLRSSVNPIGGDDGVTNHFPIPAYLNYRYLAVLRKKGANFLTFVVTPLGEQRYKKESTTNSGDGVINRTLIIGGYQDSNNNYGRYFNGTIHSVKVYKEGIDLWEIYDILEEATS